MFPQESPAVSRRRFLKMSGAGLAGMKIAGSMSAGLFAGTVLQESAVAETRAGSSKDSPYGHFKMGIQSYSLREYKLDEALDWTGKLGLEHWESFNKHLPMTESAEAISSYKQKLGAAGVKVLAYGVVGFGADKAKNRAAFQFAKAMGISVLSADPEPQSLEQLDELVEEFGVLIAIHNHGPGSRYDKIRDVEAVLQDHHERIGACVDTGHYLRAREEPVEAVRRFGKRVYGVHLKDVRDSRMFTVLGEGDLDIAGVCRELKRLKYDQCLALEYEENPKDPIDDIRRSLAAVRAAIARL